MMITSWWIQIQGKQSRSLYLCMYVVVGIQVSEWISISICIYVIMDAHAIFFELANKKELRDFSPQANYIDRATAACRRS
jgi:hypothetical protein